MLLLSLLQVCVVWRGGKSPSGAEPGTFGAGGCIALSAELAGRNPERAPSDAAAGEKGMWVTAKGGWGVCTCSKSFSMQELGRK